MNIEIKCSQRKYRISDVRLCLGERQKLLHHLERCRGTELYGLIINRIKISHSQIKPIKTRGKPLY